VGFGAGIERLLIALEGAGVQAEHPPVEAFFVLESDAPRLEVSRWLADLRARGVSADTDYAGRSVKGQLTQAGRLGARMTVVVGKEQAVLRTADRPDETLDHAEIVGRLSR
jgi:histidyl-tRNA synthetase